ncbi:hypothetical protein CPB84DRAFT_1851897 [Gymnopilus junonius]|uniref:C3H1-type domain-containing protein n=1 Tax=Gymnopilus junonius TaxID=109634 RepID=A0A9P5NDP6_GYMJU|nr:hypothetical protein CPB84DRAFT_1851897 [Gymnopilus junonius]
MSTSAQAGGNSRSTQRRSQSQKDCFNWKQGNCRFGAKCKFRHDPAVKRTSPVAQKKEATTHSGSKPSGSTVGSNPAAEGATAAGATPSKAGRDVKDNINSQPPCKPPAMCRDWKAGKCTRGAKCRYRHSDQESISTSSVNNEREAQAREQGMREAEAAKREVERLEVEARQERERAEREEKLKLAQEKKERKKTLRQERARKVEEERLRREAERLAQEKEAEEAKKRHQAKLEKDATVVEQYMVQDSSLVTLAAGLHIRNVVTGFDLCKVTIKNLPKGAKRTEIADLFLQQGVDQSEFFISQVKQDSHGLEAIVLANAEHGHAIALGLEGIEFRDEILNFNISENASFNSMDASAQNMPFFIISWKAPSSTVVVAYPTMQEAREKARTLNRTKFKGRQIRAEMNERPQGLAGLRHFVESSIKILGLPPNTPLDIDFVEMTGTWNQKVLKSADFSLENSFTRIREHLSRAHGVRMDTYEKLESGLGLEGDAKVKIQFEDWEDAKKAKASVAQIRQPDAPIIGHGSTQASTIYYQHTAPTI